MDAATLLDMLRNLDPDGYVGTPLHGAVDIDIRVDLVDLEAALQQHLTAAR